MTNRPLRLPTLRALLLAFVPALAACATAAPAPRATSPSPYLLVFAGDKDEADEDFLAVVDLRDRRAGKVLATRPVGVKASMPHHMEYALPPAGEALFLNAHHSEETLLVDTSRPTAPIIARRLKPPPPYRFTHDYWRLPNGNRLVGFLRSDGPSPQAGDSDNPGNHGGIAEYTAKGELIRTASAAVAGFPEPIRPYAFAPVPEHDRLVTTSASMMETNSADVVQIWRSSDLKLLHTLRMPKGKPEKAESTPFEPRLMADGSILLNAYGCGLYRLTGVESDAPKLEHVFTFAAEEPDPKRRGACGVPVVEGKWWVMPVGRAHRMVTLDISDPARPRIAAQFATAEDFRPHWSAKDPASDRVVVGAELGGEQGMLILRLDPATGELRPDERVTSASGRPGYLDLAMDTWPHGKTGAAWAHAALFMPGE
jgi:hypothetical protein